MPKIAVRNTAQKKKGKAQTDRKQSMLPITQFKTGRMWYAQEMKWRLNDRT